MKLRVVDVYRSGLQWEFVSAGTENILGDPGQQLRFPPAIELFSTASNPNSNSKEAELPGSSRPTPVPDQPQSRSNGDAQLASAGIVPTAALPPYRKHEHPGSPNEQLPNSALDQENNHEQFCETPPPPSLPTHNQRQVQPTAIKGPAPPPGFDIKIEAPAAAHDVQAAAPSAGPFFPASPLEGGIGSGFDYFTSTPSPTQTSPSHAWAAGLPLAAAQAPQAGTHITGQYLGMGGSGGRGVLVPPQQPQQQQPVAPIVTHAPVQPPATAKAQPPKLPPAGPSIPGSNRPSSNRGAFRLDPREAAARRAKLSAIQAELGAILFGNDPDEDAGDAGAMLMGFQKAGDGIKLAAAAPAATVPAVSGAALLHTANPLHSVQPHQHTPVSIHHLESSSQDRKRGREEVKEAAGNPLLADGKGDDTSGAPPRKLQCGIEEVGGSEHQAAPALSFCFTSGNGRKMTVDPKKLEAAKRLLEIPGEKELNTSLASNREQSKALPMPRARLFGEEPAPHAAAQQQQSHLNTSAVGALTGAGGGFAGFSTASGNKVDISEAKLAAARRMMAEVEASVADPNCNINPENLNNDDDVSFEARPLPLAGDLGPNGGPAPLPAFSGFSSGNGKKLEVSEAKLAAAKRLMDLSEPTEEEVARTPGPAAPDTEDRDTPALRKQVLRSKFSSTTPSGTTPGTAGPLRTALPPPHRLSRFGAQAGATAGATAAGSLAIASVHPDSAPVARKGRGKFTTPRPMAPKPQGLHGGVTPRSGGTTPTMHQQQQPRSSTATPLHDLTSSALKAARVEALTNQAQLHPGAASSRAGALSSTAPWPSRLPLDSLQTGKYMFVGQGGVQIGWEGMREALINAGANPQYATDEWVRNHYRWVVSKLARAELAGGHTTAGHLLTATTAEDELRRRYEREFNHGHRPFLKTVLQQDVPAATLAVLMVASIRTSPTEASHSTDGAVIELTDGWYWIIAQCDAVLSQHVVSGRIRPGTKLRVCGAELAASGPGDPLTAARSAVLKLHANGVHPVPYSTKLGRQDHLSTFLPLAAVHPRGGIVPQTLVVVLRRYPRLMWTKLPSGVSTFQTLRAQAAAERRLHEEITQATSTAAADVQAAEQRRCKEWLERGKPGGMTQVDRWYATMVTGDADEFIRSLNQGDRDTLERYTAARRSELDAETHRAAKAALAADVPAALGAGSKEAALLLVGEIAHEGTRAGRDVAHAQRPPATALVTVWRPSDDLAGMKEGEVYAVAGLEPNRDNRGQGGGGGGAPAPVLLPDAVLQLEAGPRCQWRKIATSIAELPKTLAGHAMPRAVPTLAGLGAVASAAATCLDGHRAAAFDFNGIVLKVGPVYQNIENIQYPQYQWIFLADHSLGQDEASAMQGWLLAVRLQGPQDAVSWLDPGDEGTTVVLHDLELLGRDDGPRMWRAAGGKHSAVVVVHGGSVGVSGRVRGGGDPEIQAVGAWASDCRDIVQALRARVEALLAG